MGEVDRPQPKGPRLYKPQPGFTWNPLLRIPRNKKCPCKSGKKFKECHLKTMPQCIPIKLAREYQAALDKTDNFQFVEDIANPSGVIEAPDEQKTGS